MNGESEPASLPVLKLGHNNGNVTTIGFGIEPDHAELDELRNANHDDLNDHSKAMRNWLLSLPDEHQPYWTHLMQVDHLWPSHGEAPPVWVSSPDHPVLEQAVAAHFSVRGHEVQVGNPNDADAEA